MPAGNGFKPFQIARQVEQQVIIFSNAIVGGHGDDE